MKSISTLLLSMGLVASLASCSTGNDSPEGSWTMASPTSVTADVAGASSASEMLSMDFAPSVNGEPGVVTLSADYDVTTGAAADSAATTSYKVTATVKGTWAQDMDDHDDYLLTFDRNTLDVKGTDAPELGPVTDAFLKSMAQFTTIEDVEVSKDGTHMTFETGKPEVKFHMVKK